MKIRLIEAKRVWADELYSVFWSYQPALQRPTGETPFRLTFGVEAVISMEIGLPTTKLENFHEESKLDWLKINLDFLDKIKEGAQICMTTYKQKVPRYYNARVKLKLFHKGDLVLHGAKILKPSEQRKLVPN